MKKQIELLAPAGSSEALHAAVENGADAVYLGGKLFNARAQADNFNMDVLKEELDYAHARGVNIYLTMNTLVSDDELKQALLFAADARGAGIDGIIVQDLGLAGALHRVMPDVPLHGSTQMTIYDRDGVRALENMGFKRVVLARELALQEASEIARNTRLEVEVFVHGALCVCYSGQCLMSSIIGGRSGNRGRCAQPCRLPYRLICSTYSGQKPQYSEEIRCNPDAKLPEGSRSSHNKPSHNDLRVIDIQDAQYLLSPKDMCSLEHIDEIVASGIRSLKIEGRMKSPEYVATVVRIYRKYLDLAMKRVQGQQLEGTQGKEKQKISEADMHDLLQIFNRGGFSSGYMKGKTGRDMMSFNKPNNSGIYLGSVISYDERSQNIHVKLEDNLSIGDGIEIWTGGSDSPGGVVTSIRRVDIPKIQKAENKEHRPDQSKEYPLPLSIAQSSLKTAERGDLVAIGNFRGRIIPGKKIYKTLDIELNRAARETFNRKSTKRIEVSGYTVLKAGQPLMLKVEDHEGHIVSAAGTILPETARNKPLTEEWLKDRLNRTGSTPFTFAELRIELEEGLSLPVSEINEVRRQALETLLKTRADRFVGLRNEDGIRERIEQVLEPAYMVSGHTFKNNCKECPQLMVSGHTFKNYCMESPQLNVEIECEGGNVGIKPNIGHAIPAISLYFYKWNPSINYAGLGADRVYLPFTSLGVAGFRDIVSELRRAGVEVFGWLPSVTRGNCGRLIDRFLNGKGTLSENSTTEVYSNRVNGMHQENGYGLDGILAGNIGTVHRLREMCKTTGKSDLKLAGDISLNLYNALSIQEAVKLGLCSVALSIEMTLQQIKELKSADKLYCKSSNGSNAAIGELIGSPAIEAAVYGRLPLMISEHCPAGCVEGGFNATYRCSGSCSRGGYKLKDRMGIEFPLLCDKLDCRSTILNSNVLFVPDNLRSIKAAGVDIFRLYIWDEAPEVIMELIQLYRAAISGDSKQVAAHSGLADRVRAAGFTRGYLR